MVMIDTDRIGSCKFSYHTITITTAPNKTVNRYASNISGVKYQSYSEHINKFDVFLYILDIRLVNGQYPWQGRVEVFYNNRWSTICDHLFDRNEAQVICSMLGYDRNGYSFY